MMAETKPMPMCPMAETCKSMVEKPFSGMLLMLPGLVLVAIGMLIVIWPVILLWLVAAACVLSGVAMLVMVTFIRRIGSRLNGTR